MKLIPTKEYLLLIDEKAKCLKDTWAIFPNTTNGIISDFNGCNPVKCKWDYAANGVYNLRIVAYYPLTKEAKELDLPLLPNPFVENNVDKLAKEKAREGGPFSIHVQNYEYMFKEGYKAAQSLFGKLK